jgi:hypothetical protein
VQTVAALADALQDAVGLRPADFDFADGRATLREMLTWRLPAAAAAQPAARAEGDALTKGPPPLNVPTKMHTIIAVIVSTFR